MFGGQNLGCTCHISHFHHICSKDQQNKAQLYHDNLLLYTALHCLTLHHTTMHHTAYQLRPS